MKVIGRSENGYLISATEDEIANLFGHRSTYDDNYKKTVEIQLGRHKAMHDGIVGLEINVGVAYERLAWLLRRNREFDQLVMALRSTADKIDDHRPLFDRIAGDDGKAA